MSLREHTFLTATDSPVSMAFAALALAVCLVTEGVGDTPDDSISALPQFLGDAKLVIDPKLLVEHLEQRMSLMRRHPGNSVSDTSNHSSQRNGLLQASEPGTRRLLHRVAMASEWNGMRNALETDSNAAERGPHPN